MRISHVAAAAITLALGFGSAANAADVRFMTGPQAGFWVPLGGQLKDAFEKSIPDLKVQSLPGAGIANVRAIQEGKAEVGFGNTISTADAFAVSGYGNATNYGAEGLRFLSPVPAGSKVHARRRLKAVEKTDKGTKVTQQVAIHVVGSERPALLVDSIVLYQPPRK